MFAFANKVLRNWVLGKKKGGKGKKKKSELALVWVKKEKRLKNYLNKKKTTWKRKKSKQKHSAKSDLQLVCVSLSLFHYTSTLKPQTKTVYFF